MPLSTAAIQDLASSGIHPDYMPKAAKAIDEFNYVNITLEIQKMEKIDKMRKKPESILHD